MMTIAEYPLRSSGRVELQLPSYANVLDVQWFRAKGLVLFATVNSDAIGRETRVFLIATTGARLDGEKLKSHVATIQLDGGATVLHVFEVSP